MPLPPSQPPQDIPEELRWRVIKVRPTVGVPFILAGAPFGCQTHHPRKRTLPCYRSLQGCRLACPWCKFERRFTCWVPLIDTSVSKQQKVVVMGGKRTWKCLEGIEPGKVVGLIRGQAERDTVLFKELADDTLNILHLKKWRAHTPFDIRPYCFHLWQLRDVSHDFGIPFHPSLRTEEMEREMAALGDGPDLGPQM